MRAGRVALQIGIERRHRAGAVGVGPSLVVQGLAGLFVECGDALARLRHVRAGSEILDVAVEGRNGPGTLGVSPGLLVRLLAGLLVERGNPFARLGHVRARAEVLDVAVEGRGGSGADRFGPGLLVGVLARLLVRGGLLLPGRLLGLRLLGRTQKGEAAPAMATTASLRHASAGNGFGRARQITVHGRTVVRFARSPRAVLRIQYVPKYRYRQR